MRGLIFEKRAGSLEVATDSNLIKLLQKSLNVMGPLFKVWTTVEKVSNSRFKQVEVSLPEILMNLDQPVMLLGQAFNILYIWHFNGLKQITGDPRKTKQFLNVKTKQKPKEVFSTMTSKQQHFRRGPLQGHQRNKGRE